MSLEFGHDSEWGSWGKERPVCRSVTWCVHGYSRHLSSVKLPSTGWMGDARLFLPCLQKGRGETALRISTFEFLDTTQQHVKPHLPDCTCSSACFLQPYCSTSFIVCIFAFRNTIPLVFELFRLFTQNESSKWVNHGACPISIFAHLELNEDVLTAME